MKRILTYSILLIILGFFLSGNLFGQRIKGTVIVGGGLTQVEGDEIKGWSQFGFNGGLGAIVPFAKHWGINIETLFSQKGSFQKVRYPSDSLTDEYRLRLNYFEVPLYITYTDKDVMTFGLGGYFARLVSAREEEHSGKQDPYIDKVPFNDNDFGFLVDFKVRIWKSLHVNVRYTQSLISIRERVYYHENGEPYANNQFNQVINLRFVYIFNESRQQAVPE